MKNFVVCLCMLAMVLGCNGGGGSEENTTGPGSQAGITFTQEQRIIADQIMSVFENDTPAIQYGYAENLHDGRGVTAGRAGFTSATGDMLLDDRACIPSEVKIIIPFVVSLSSYER